MLTFYPVSGSATQCAELSICDALTEQSAWIDLVAPTAEEEHAVETALGIDVPTKDEMQDIATSSRLYEEGKALFMTATILTRSDTSHPEASAVTFILTAKRLITVRYAEPLAFVNFGKRRDANPQAFATSTSVFQGLLDAIVERTADILENVGAGLEALSLEVFSPRAGGKREARDYREMLTRLGRYSDLASKTRESLLSLARLCWFYQESDKAHLAAEEIRPLAWPLGYPLAILMMIGSAILPFYWFKQKGWL
jgi:magnesium transporter